MTNDQANLLHNSLTGFVYKRVKNKTLRDDIVQDVYLKATTKMHQLKDAEKLTAWIYQIARNTILDHYRNNSKPVPLETGEMEAAPDNYNECAARCLKDLIPSLPEKYRVPFHLIEIENLSQTTLTQQLGISYSGVKSRVQRARKMLREKLNQTLIIKTDAYGNVIVCKDRRM